MCLYSINAIMISISFFAGQHGLYIVVKILALGFQMLERNHHDSFEVVQAFQDSRRVFSLGNDVSKFDFKMVVSIVYLLLFAVLYLLDAS